MTSIVDKPWIDLFATKQSYVSHVPDGRTYSVDALPTHWGGTSAYAYPPHALLPKILSKDYIVLLIAPAFLQAQWFQTLLGLSIEIPVRLPANRRILNLCRMYSIPGWMHCVPGIVSLCLDIISKSKHQQNIYLITVCWRILDNVKTRYQQQYISYYFVEEL